MKRTQHSLMPFALAVLATAGLGAYLKLRTAEDVQAEKPREIAGPKEIKVEIVRSGSGVMNDFMAKHPGVTWPVLPTPLRSAAWMSFRTYADGKLRIPDLSDARLDFFAIDDEGNQWPVQIAKGTKEAIAYIEESNAIAPKELWLECDFKGTRIGRWKMPNLPKPKRIFSARDARRDVNKDFPTLGLEAVVTITEGSTSARISLSTFPQMAKDAWEVPSIHAHSFGIVQRRGDGSVSVPVVYLKYVDAIEVNVVSVRKIPRTAKVKVPSGQIARKDGEPRIVIDPVGPIEVMRGAQVVLEPMWFMSKSGIKMTTKVAANVAVGLDGIDIKGYSVPELTDIGLRQRLFEIVPREDQTTFEPLDVTIRYHTVKAHQPRRYILKLPKPTPPRTPGAVF